MVGGRVGAGGCGGSGVGVVRMLLVVVVCQRV